MAVHLRVLLIEDTEEDTELLELELRRGGYDPVVVRVDTPDGLRERLREDDWDVAVSDYTMPHFHGMEALDIVKASGLDIPFILLSGTIGEDVAVDAMVRGAQDYIMKDKRARLIPAIERELRAVRQRRERRESEERYRELVQSANSIILRMDILGNIRFCNEFAKRFFGYSEQELLGKNVVGTIVPEVDSSGRNLREVIQDVCLRPECYANNENENCCRDGRRVWIAWTNQPLRDARGRFTEILCIGNDITARKRAEDALREAEERYQVLFESAHDGIALLYEGHLVDCNQAQLDMFGAEWDELIGHTADESAPPLQADGRSSKEVASYYVGLALQGNPQVFEWRALAADGHVFDTEVSIGKVEIRGQPHVLSVTRDISERKRAAAELDKTRSLLIAAIEQCPVGILIADAPDNRIRLTNKAIAEIHGEAPEDLVGDPGDEHSSHWRILHLDGKPIPYGDLPLFRATMRGETSHDVEMIVRRPTGEDRTVSANAAPVRNADGEIVAAVAVVSDITDRLHLERQFRQAQKMEAIGTLAGGIAHDFNNILQVILGHASLARCELPGNGLAGSCLQEIVTAAHRATDLVKQILAFSRQVERQRAPLKAQRILKEALKLLRGVLPATIEIRSEIDPDCGAVLADPTRIHQVVMNLCTNAYHAMRATGGVLEVRWDDVALDGKSAADCPELRPGHYAQLTVSDTGCGMDEDILKRIFDPYFTTKKPGEGTGLGLSVAHGIVKELDGAILVDSKSGAGSRFRVLLPIVADSNVPRPEIHPPIQTSFAGTERILFVDDEIGIVHIVEYALTQCGYRVDTATNGLEARDRVLAQPGRYDIVVTDQTMPHMTGAQLAREILRVRPELPFILCTGHSDLLDEGKIAETGVRKLILKPFLPETLLEAIRGILDPPKEAAACPPRPPDSAHGRQEPQ